MGIGVLDMVDMYATTICGSQSLLPKESLETSGSSCRGIKRCMSAVSEDSGRPRTPRTPRSCRSPRRQRCEKLTPLSTPSPDRSSGRYTYTPTTYDSTDTEDEEIVKRSRLESSSSSSMDSSSKFRESYESRRRRFLRTAEALRHSGLLDVTMKTAELLQKNQDLQREIETLQKETRSFVLSVLMNPENRPILDNIRSQAQLYEIVVPGSQGIMSVTSSSSLPEHSLPCGNNNLQSDDDSLASNDSMSSQSPAPTESDYTSSLSEDSDSSEKENLAPPKREFRFKQ